MSFLSILGTGLSVVSQIRQGQQQKKLFEFNAAVSRQQADLAAQAGKLKVDRARRQAKSFSKKQAAAFAGAGVRLTGSPLQVLADTAAELEMDIMIEEFNTQVAISNANSAAELELIKGQQAQTASIINAGTTLLTQLPSFVNSGNLGNIPISGRATFENTTVKEFAAGQSLINR